MDAENEAEERPEGNANKIKCFIKCLGVKVKTHRKVDIENRLWR
jgi:hypothetical protein